MQQLILNVGFYNNFIGFRLFTLIYAPGSIQTADVNQKKKMTTYLLQIINFQTIYSALNDLPYAFQKCTSG